MRERFIHLSTAWEVSSSGNSGWNRSTSTTTFGHKVDPSLQKTRELHRTLDRTWWSCSYSCVKAGTPDRKWTNYYYPHPSFPYVAWFGWTAANHPPKGSKSRRSIILPPSQLHWHAQSAHGHQHQPPSAYFTDPALCEGFHSLPVDESAKGSSERSTCPAASKPNRSTSGPTRQRHGAHSSATMVGVGEEECSGLIPAAAIEKESKWHFWRLHLKALPCFSTETKIDTMLINKGFKPHFVNEAASHGVNFAFLLPGIDLF